MKILRLLCNILLLIAVTIGISVLQIGVYDLTAAQSSSVDEIHIYDGTDSEVAYFDSYTFWANDIKTNFDTDVRHRVRSWSKAAWWKKTVGKWADYAIDGVVSVVKPIVVPIASVNGARNYFDMCINSEEIEGAIRADYDSTSEMNDSLYELYFIFNDGYNAGVPVYVIGDHTILLENYQYPAEKRNALLSEINEVGEEVAYGRWIVKNRNLYNQNWRLKKYNSGDYAKYSKKFLVIQYARNDSGEILYDELGMKIESAPRVIKTAISVLYYQHYISLLLAIIFVAKYPVNFIQANVTGKKSLKNSVVG